MPCIFWSAMRVLVTTVTAWGTSLRSVSVLVAVTVRGATRSPARTVTCSEMGSGCRTTRTPDPGPSTSSDTDVKCASLTVTRACSGAFSNLKRPAASVTVSRGLAESASRVTVAPTTTAPVGSKTVPLRVRDSAAATGSAGTQGGADAASVSTAIVARRRMFFRDIGLAPRGD